ncbi:MAG: methyltransferase [Bacteroidetes bacterium]|nr:methyltransferase [Bacteroidota bacterium]
MDFIGQALTQYCEQHSSSESELLQQLAKETWQKVINPRMLSGSLQGAYLKFISNLVQPRRILEIGTYTGYSALCLVEGLKENGELITLEEDDELSYFHQKYFPQHSKGKLIESKYGDAKKTLNELDGSFDLIFIDADKQGYLQYWDWCSKHVSSTGIILIDNVLWNGKVIQPFADKDLDTQVLLELNKAIQENQQFENVLLPLRDGMMMVKRKDNENH